MLKMYKPSKKSFKKFIVKTVFYILGKSLQTVSNKDCDVCLELSSWANKRKIIMNVMDKGPSMAISTEKLKLKYVGKTIENPDIVINFRNIDSAFLMMTGQIGMPQAYAEHRLFVKGILNNVMEFVKITDCVESILFPRFIQKKIFRRLPEMNRKKYILRVILYFKAIGWFFQSLFKG